ncbi:MAG: hypothetical protein AMJ69_01025 [Gammaproteobacteria bacterium SG8_47]|nr:MAG: hypothetical protein AMJ69_01025 [Gammaproteobacteria bacterium SG8_47]
MRLLTVVCLVCALGTTPTSWAQEHYACNDTALGSALRDSAQLRTIAASCTNRPISELYYNRASHLDLVDEARVLDGLIAFGAHGSSDTLLGYQMYIAMIESFAPVWFPRLEDRVLFLNAEYERRGEIARLRLRGYDPLADRLERQSGGLTMPVRID